MEEKEGKNNFITSKSRVKELKKEIRIFPNSQKYEFVTKEELVDYLKNRLRSQERNGRYNFRSFRPVKNITVGSIALFRFASDIMGWGEISKRAVYEPFKRNNDNYEGVIMFQPKSIKVFDPPLTIRKLEQITNQIFHFKENYNTGRSYYKIPFSFKSNIESVVNEV